MKRRRFTKQPAIELCDLDGVPRPLGGDKKELRGSTETSRARGACSTERRSMPRMLVAKISPRSASRNTLPQLIHKRTKPDKCIRCHFESFWGCNAKSFIRMSYFTVIFTWGFPILIILIIFKINCIIWKSSSQKIIIGSFAKIIFVGNFATGWPQGLKTATELGNLNPLVTG